MLLATALALRGHRMCSADVYCSKQTGGNGNKETITIISSFLELGWKTVDAAKICGGAENVH